MRKSILLILITLLPFKLLPQQLTLDECVRMARQHYPLAANRELADRLASIRTRVIKTAWLPAIELNAQASWQSDVVAFDLDLPFPVNFPQIPRDQYRATLDISQVIYDGGATKSTQAIEEINASITRQEVDVGEAALVETVEDLFFAILLVDRRIEVLNLMRNSLEATGNQVESGIRNGLLSEPDLLGIRAEMVRLDQSELQLKSLKKSALNAMTHLTGLETSQGTALITPDLPNINLFGEHRPEFGLFQLRNDLLDAQSRQLGDRHKPRLAAFGQAGYGKPGLNFLGDSWDPYLMIGIRFSWTPYDFGRIRGQQNALDINKLSIAAAMEAFRQQLTMAHDRQMLTIAEINSLLERDRELLQIREQISSAYASRLNNGLITSATYLAEWSREQEARVALESRMVELLAAQYKLLRINGKN
jgi:outer membrane protein TolC